MSYKDYFDEIEKADDTARLNDLIEHAAFNDALTDEEYEEVYRTAVYKSLCC